MDKRRDQREDDQGYSAHWRRNSLENNGRDFDSAVAVDNSNTTTRKRSRMYVERKVDILTSRRTFEEYEAQYGFGTTQNIYFKRPSPMQQPPLTPAQTHQLLEKIQQFEQNQQFLQQLQLQLFNTSTSSTSSTQQLSLSPLYLAQPLDLIPMAHVESPPPEIQDTLNTSTQDFPVEQAIQPPARSPVSELQLLLLSQEQQLRTMQPTGQIFTKEEAKEKQRTKQREYRERIRLREARERRERELEEKLEKHQQFLLRNHHPKQ